LCFLQRISTQVQSKPLAKDSIYRRDVFKGL